ncbi:MAG TPA: hypothetical protein VGW78_07045 [Candidatus Babeliales bacterium]|jgi:hypothetical protein|nr:hypothetical protein [Candidatus Babeliales bacterium]
MKKFYLRIFALTLLSVASTYSMEIINNITSNWKSYKLAIDRRFSKHRPIQHWTQPYLETFADYAPLIGGTIGITNHLQNFGTQLINKLPDEYQGTKKLLIEANHSFNDALVYNTIWTACNTMFKYDIGIDYILRSPSFRPQDQNVLEKSHLPDPQIISVAYPMFFPAWNEHGIPKVSPLKLTAISVATYMGTNLGLQTATSLAINKISIVSKAVDTFNEKVDVAPGTASALISLGAMVLARYIINN